VQSHSLYREIEKIMSSERQIEANRRNAQKSTGPRTAEGKDRSRFNAVTHGMTAKFDALPGEDSDALKGRIDAWTADLKPRNPLERDLIERAARVSWQLERVERAQVARLTANILKATSGEDPPGEAHRQCAERDAASAVDQLAFDDSRKGELLRKYEASCSRTLFRTIDMLYKVRRASNAGKLVPAAVTVESSTESVAPSDHGITENKPNSVSIENTVTGSVAPRDHEITENKPNFLPIENTEHSSVNGRKGSVLYRDDRKPRASSRKRYLRSRGGHWRGLLSAARPTRGFGAGRRTPRNRSGRVGRREWAVDRERSTGWVEFRHDPPRILGRIR
jgi:hypothetical protein